jgi:hypothetical protein
MVSISYNLEVASLEMHDMRIMGVIAIDVTAVAQMP